MHLGDHGQPRVQNVLKDMFLRHRVGGSFLFDGPAGVGKEALAVELGRLLNCESEGSCEPRGLFREPPTDFADEACSSCRRFVQLQHPDLHLVFPVPTGFWEKAGRPDAKLDKDFPTASCDASTVQEHYAIGRDVGLSGTPAIVLEDGTLIGGYLPPDQLKARLDQLSAE